MEGRRGGGGVLVSKRRGRGRVGGGWGVDSGEDFWGKAGAGD